MAFFEVEEVEQVLKKVVELFLVPRFKELGMPATGEWEQNLEVVAESNSGKIRGRDYSQQLAFGRKPGKRPPVAPLQKWVMAKFGKGSKEALGIAYAISKKIETEGTTWYQKGVWGLPRFDCGPRNRCGICLLLNGHAQHSRL